MATSGELIRIMARALALPSATVTSYHRVLREHGMITKGGRGRSAATMSAEDVARLLIALLSADNLEEAPYITQLMCDAPSTAFDDDDIPVIGFEKAVVILLYQLREVESGTMSKSGLLPGLDRVRAGHLTLKVSASLLCAYIVNVKLVLEFCRSDNYPITFPDDWMSLPVEERLLARAQIGGLLITRLVNRAVLRDIAAALP